MKNYNLPTRAECFELLEQFNTPQHIIKHSLAVAELAVSLARKLNANGETVNIELVEKACLLHDILRICDLERPDYTRFEGGVTKQDLLKWSRIKTEYNQLSHEDAAYKLLKNKFPALALAVKKHRYTAISKQADKPQTWEEKLVYYADKRVEHNKVLPLKTRLKQGHKRNTPDYETDKRVRAKTEEIDALIYELEQEIFEKARLPRQQLNGQ